MIYMLDNRYNNPVQNICGSLKHLIVDIFYFIVEFYEIGYVLGTTQQQIILLPALIRQDPSLLLKFCNVFSGFQSKMWYSTTK
jgi:hypothetical protein